MPRLSVPTRIQYTYDHIYHIQLFALREKNTGNLVFHRNKYYGFLYMFHGFLSNQATGT